MTCTMCSEPISTARLRAVPTADKCITCASKNDVPMTRRFDDHVGDVTVENYYTGKDTPEIVAYKGRLRRVDFSIWPSQDEVGNHYPRNGKMRSSRQDEIMSVSCQADVSELAETTEESDVV